MSESTHRIDALLRDALRALPARAPRTEVMPQGAVYWRISPGEPVWTIYEQTWPPKSSKPGAERSSTRDMDTEEFLRGNDPSLQYFFYIDEQGPAKVVAEQRLAKELRSARVDDSGQTRRLVVCRSRPRWDQGRVVCLSDLPPDWATSKRWLESEHVPDLERASASDADGIRSLTIPAGEIGIVRAEGGVGARGALHVEGTAWIFASTTRRRPAIAHGQAWLWTWQHERWRPEFLGRGGNR